MKTLKSKVAEALSLITKDNGVYSVPDAHVESLFENDSDIENIKEKCKKVTEKMNSLSAEELEKFMDKDFETEIWGMILTVKFQKSIKKLKHPYLRRYTSTTHYELFIDGVSKGEIQVGNKFKSFKNFLTYAKEKYGFTEYTLFDMGTWTGNAQL